MMRYRTGRGSIVTWRQSSPANVVATAAPRKRQTVEARANGHITILGPIRETAPVVMVTLSQLSATAVLGSISVVESGHTIAPRNRYSVQSRGRHVRVLSNRVPTTVTTITIDLTSLSASSSFGSVSFTRLNGVPQRVQGGLRNLWQRIGGVDM